MSTPGAEISGLLTPVDARGLAVAVGIVGGNADTLGGTGRLADTIEGVAGGESVAACLRKTTSFVAGVVLLVGHIPSMDGTFSGGDEELRLQGVLVDVNLDMGTVVEGIGMLDKYAVACAHALMDDAVIDDRVAHSGAEHRRAPDGAVIFAETDAGAEVVVLLTPHDEHLASLADAVDVAGTYHYGA